MSTPFFPPSYFAPTYFGEFGPSSPAEPGEGGIYYAPTYFPATYFGKGYFASGQAAPLPYDLAEAIVARFAAEPSLSGDGAFTAIYRDQAGDRAVLPYLVYAIKRGPVLLKTSSSSWYDDRVTFKAWAATGAQANNLADAVASVLEPAGRGLNLSFQTGGTAPLYETDRSQGKGTSRGPNSTYTFWACIEYSARTSRGGS